MRISDWSSDVCSSDLAGYDYMAGLEVEFHVFKLVDPKLAPTDAGQPGNPPEVGLLTQGYQYLTEQRYDQYEEGYEILRRDIQALGLPLRTLEVECGPSPAQSDERRGRNEGVSECRDGWARQE